ncbi:SgcJ/EcaC family oxidoreductase [Nocardia sp. NPDC050712]|uniref:SgcJ/EcaC family oxidoreductase n=1 Tax=Nocardia sp. NPDC050712 TaxID=3155518 RepID=UPI00340FD061
MTSIDSSQSDATAVLSDADLAAIRDLVDLADRSQADAAVLPGLHTDDTRIVNFYGRRLFGRAAFEAAMGAALGQGLGQVRTSLEVLDIQALTVDTVLVSLIKTVHDERPDAQPAPASSGAMSYVLVRTADGWKIGLAQTTPIITD